MKTAKWVAYLQNLDIISNNKATVYYSFQVVSIIWQRQRDIVTVFA